ncbi:MAG TPA: DUF6370 family protein [Verrucomicrobiae bacterium]|jgi:hypothetical protein
MKKLILILTAGVLLAGTAGVAKAEIVTVTGNMVCAKCVLHLTTECQNAVQVTDGTNTVTYLLKMNDVSKTAHPAVCGGSSEKVTVTGKVKVQDNIEVLTPTKIDVVKP